MNLQAQIGSGKGRGSPLQCTPSAPFGKRKVAATVSSASIPGCAERAEESAHFVWQTNQPLQKIDCVNALIHQSAASIESPGSPPW
jgi:hypothetical protein